MGQIRRYKANKEVMEKAAEVYTRLKSRVLGPKMEAVQKAARTETERERAEVGKAEEAPAGDEAPTDQAEDELSTGEEQGGSPRGPGTSRCSPRTAGVASSLRLLGAPESQTAQGSCIGGTCGGIAGQAGREEKGCLLKGQRHWVPEGQEGFPSCWGYVGAADRGSPRPSRGLGRSLESPGQPAGGASLSLSGESARFSPQLLPVSGLAVPGPRAAHPGLTSQPCRWVWEVWAGGMCWAHGAGALDADGGSFRAPVPKPACSLAPRGQAHRVTSPSPHQISRPR